MKFRKRTPEANARISEIVDLRMKIPTYYELGKELHLAPLYIAQLVSAEIRKRKKSMNPHTQVPA